MDEHATTSPAAKAAEAAQRARAEAQRVASAFLAVFGAGSRRGEFQRTVMDYLGQCAGDDANSYRFNEARDGIAMIAAGIHRDGAKSMLRIVERQVALATDLAKPQKTKPIVRKR